MPRKARPLVRFDASYYKYPNVSPGLCVIDPSEFEFPTSERRIREESLAEVTKWFHTGFHKIVNETFADPSDDEIFRSLLTVHGVFTEKFFHKAIRERVTGQFAKAQIDLREFERLLSLASSSIRGYEHEWPIHNRWEAIFRIIDHIFRQTMHRAFSKPQVYHQLRVWFEEFRAPQVCALCDNEFRVIDLPEWVYFGSNQ